jgi:hypothetical protein
MDTQSSTVESRPIRYQACSAFRAGDDAVVCSCGWFEDEHG